MEGVGKGRERRGGKRGKKKGWVDGGGRGRRKGSDEEKGKERGGEGSWCPPMTYLRHAPASIAAEEKRPMSYQMPQSVHVVRNCRDQTLPLTMHYRGKKLGEIGEGMVGF